MEVLISLKDVLTDIDKYKWSDALFLPEDEVWELQSKCAVLDPDDVEDDADDAPRFAMDNNLVYALSIQDVKGIVKNAYEQKSNCLEKDLLEAFLYYYDNDAFIDFDKRF
jgi:hypothetical protein